MIAGSIADRERFVLDNTRLHPVPHAPKIVLHVADEAVPLWQRTESELERDGLEPPFWAFAWAGGQGLARYVLDHAVELRDRKVLDFASGSGLVGIAAARVGAQVTCIDVDPLAAAAAGLNARANGVDLSIRTGDVVGADRAALGHPDIVLAGDIHYDRAMAERVTQWLLSLRRDGARVLVGDPGRSYFPCDLGWRELARYDVPVTRELEDSEIRSVGVFEVT